MQDSDLLTDAHHIQSQNPWNIRLIFH